MEHPCFVGIDVSKAHLDVYVRPFGDSFRVGHDDAGFVTLIARVRPLSPAVVVLEATGGYQVTVAATLAGAVLPVAVEIVGVYRYCRSRVLGRPATPSRAERPGPLEHQREAASPRLELLDRPLSRNSARTPTPVGQELRGSSSPGAHRFRGLTAWRPGAQRRLAPTCNIALRGFWGPLATESVPV